jgi:hypothetical protein
LDVPRTGGNWHWFDCFWVFFLIKSFCCFSKHFCGKYIRKIVLFLWVFFGVFLSISFFDYRCFSWFLVWGSLVFCWFFLVWRLCVLLRVFNKSSVSKTNLGRVTNQLY